MDNFEKLKKSYNDNIYSISLKDQNVNQDYIEELRSSMIINKLENSNHSNLSKKVKKENEEIKVQSTLNNYSVISNMYLPKRNTQIQQSNLNQLPIPEKALKGIIKKNLYQNQEIDNFNLKTPGDQDFHTFKTNFIIKFSSNLEFYDRIYSMIDRVSENTRKQANEFFYRIKDLTEGKDRVLFNLQNKNSKDFINNWKENISIFYEFEHYWQKLIDLILKELKITTDKNIELTKKVKDNIFSNKSQNEEIVRLNEYIKKNDLSSKALNKKNKTNEINEIKDIYEKREKENIINAFHLQEEIKDLTLLLEKDKKHYNKFAESQDLLEAKKKEIDEIKIKFNQDLDEKKMKIAILKDELRCFDETLIKKDQEIQDLLKLKEDFKMYELDYHVRNSFLTLTLKEKKETIDMMSNEIETWIDMYRYELNENNNSKKIIEGLENDVVFLKKKLDELKK